MVRAARAKMRDEGTVRNKPVHLAIDVTPEGRKDVLGIWIEQTEGAKLWRRVMTEIKNRGGNDVLIAIVDGLKGFPEVINAVLSETQIQTYIVHLIHKNNEAETIIPPNTLTWLRALRSRADRTVKPGRSCEPIALESEILNEID